MFSFTASRFVVGCGFCQVSLRALGLMPFAHDHYSIPGHSVKFTTRLARSVCADCQHNTRADLGLFLLRYVGKSFSEHFPHYLRHLVGDGDIRLRVAFLPGKLMEDCGKIAVPTHRRVRSLYQRPLQ